MPEITKLVTMGDNAHMVSSSRTLVSSTLRKVLAYERILNYMESNFTPPQKPIRCMNLFNVD